MVVVARIESSISLRQKGHERELAAVNQTIRAQACCYTIEPTGSEASCLRWVTSQLVSAAAVPSYPQQSAGSLALVSTSRPPEFIWVPSRKVQHNPSKFIPQHQFRSIHHHHHHHHFQNHHHHDRKCCVIFFRDNEMLGPVTSWPCPPFPRLVMSISRVCLTDVSSYHLQKQNIQYTKKIKLTI